MVQQGGILLRLDQKNRWTSSADHLRAKHNTPPTIEGVLQIVQRPLAWQTNTRAELLPAVQVTNMVLTCKADNATNDRVSGAHRELHVGGQQDPDLMHAAAAAGAAVANVKDRESATGFIGNTWLQFNHRWGVMCRWYNWSDDSDEGPPGVADYIMLNHDILSCSGSFMSWRG
jgi:hypothetical protein